MNLNYLEIDMQVLYIRYIPYPDPVMSQHSKCIYIPFTQRDTSHIAHGKYTPIKHSF